MVVFYFSNMQKDKFLSGEGNNYFKRNFLDTNKEKMEWIKKDSLLPLLLDIPFEKDKLNVLEIGFGQGLRLEELRKRRNWNFYGLDPSLESVNYGKNNGIDSYQGTADHLPFEDKTMDIIIYGFCLYVCDNEDLFKIAFEADRVLKKNGWIAITDFWSPMPKSNIYGYDKSMKSFKSNRHLMFDWHPYYEVITHKIFDFDTGCFTDDPDAKVSASLIRKCT